MCWKKNSLRRYYLGMRRVFFLYTSLLLFSMVCFCTPELIMADKGVSGEYQIKAAFIPNFARFVTWPQACYKKGSFVFLVLGQNPFGASLEPVNRLEFKGLPASVKYTSQWNGITDDVHVLFISRSMKGDFTEVLKSLKGRPVLTISDIKGFARAGGMIEFVMREGSIHFIINLKAVRDAHLDMNFQLLQLADRVIGK